jgi:iron complex transport system permease protein
MPENRLHAGIYPVLVVLLIVSLLLSARYGAVSLSLDEIYAGIRKLFSSEAMTLNERIFTGIRLPRAVLCVLTGASLAVGGTLMQALFRNPIVEPGLIGTSSGAAFGAALYFVLGATFRFDAGQWTLPLAAGAGGVLSTAMVFFLSRSKEGGRSSIVALLLTGLAVNALFMSGVGFLSYIARDPQARSITFWSLGNLSGANWQSVQVVGVVTLVCIAVSMRFAQQLNALMLGENEAQLLGVSVRRLKIVILLINVIMIATVTAFVGIISFIGLIVPHLIRVVRGADNRLLIPATALLGGILLTLADVLARVLLRPAELPIGIVTSVIGVPVFLFLLRRKNYFF